MSHDQSTTAPPRRGAGMAIAALVLGILALVLCWTVVGGILFGLLALVLGIVASRRAGRGEASGRAMAVIGVVLGVIGLLLSIALIALGASLLNNHDVKNLRQCLDDAHGNDAKVQKCQEKFKSDTNTN